ncbi:hypothetical protein AB0A77_34025 [Streptomyces varsoviensis]|uniref:hypothetical protein n=1 Tax=Streptomyces varsoviensis TaxID=67373 RepID=UPI00340FD109
MGTDGLWIAVLTAITAVLASWVTSRGNANVARLQAKLVAETQQDAARHQVRRAAYLAFIKQAHAVGAQYRQTPGILDIRDPVARTHALKRHQEELREGYAPFLHSLAVVAIDGYGSPVEAANAVHSASTGVYMTLVAVAEGTQLRSAFTAAVWAFWRSTELFATAAREAQNS